MFLFRRRRSLSSICVVYWNYEVLARHFQQQRRLCDEGDREQRAKRKNPKSWSTNWRPTTEIAHSAVSFLFLQVIQVNFQWKCSQFCIRRVYMKIGLTNRRSLIKIMIYFFLFPSSIKNIYGELWGLYHLSRDFTSFFYVFFAWLVNPSKSSCDKTRIISCDIFFFLFRVCRRHFHP